MEKILGLDLGTNSIGWAIREVNPDLENQIIDKGVLTFDKGVAEDKSGEHPMVQRRTEARGKRRNYQSEKYRKWSLLECLINEGMCPLTIDELNKWRHYYKGIGRKYPQSEKFIQWLRFDFDGDGKPDFERLGFSKHESYYLFRTLIVDENKTEIFKNEPQIIGRVLYQLVQRRGYNDGDSIDETEKEELSKTIMKGGGDSGAVGANEIQPYIAKHKTLGAALYHIQKEQGVRIRKRYNLRSQFKAEIEEICRVQGIEHLLKTLCSAIIWQRPLRSQKGLVGVCTYERNKRRCPISHPLYEEYKTWVFINNLKIKPIVYDEFKSEEQKTKELRNVLKDVVYPQFYKASTDFKLSSIAKELKKVGFEITAKFPTDTKVNSVSFLNKMKEIFNDDWMDKIGWNDLLNGKNKTVEYSIEDLWHLHFVKSSNKKTGEEPFTFLKRFALNKLNLEEKKAELFAKIRLQQGYATLSINAIKKILPYLQKGILYSEAVYLANLPKVLGNKKLNEGDIDNFIELIKDVIKKDKQEQKQIGVFNSLVTQYFEDKENFETNKTSLIEKQLIESYGQSTWDRFSAQMQCNIENEIVILINNFLNEPKLKPENHFKKVGRIHDKIFNALLDDYGISPDNKKHLWHPSEQETYDKVLNHQEIILGKKTYFIKESEVGKFLENNPEAQKGNFYGELLGSPEPISKGFKNPMALKTLHKMKRLVNYLIQVGKIDEDTRIVIEIARELNDANKRKAIEKWQRDREKENENYKKRIDEINLECKTDYNREDKNLIDKIRLWEEQNRICIYTGKTIGLCDILNGSKYDYEHSIPASMSFDNELKNLTIADKTYNQQIKGKRIPSECPNYEEAVSINGVEYPAILSTMQSVFGRMTETEKKVKGKVIVFRSFEKIEKLEADYAEWKSKTSDDKQIKDNIIIRRHLIKMELDYWRYKLQTFSTKEYKAGWRNSQLRDTQTITKYALPFLKTIFKKVEVQKGNITADFRKIYKVQPRLEKKERTKHSHHAIDAAVLTLIPPAAIRDKILLRYNEANEFQQGYHEKPRHWDGFHQQHIIGIEDDVLINYQADHRTLTPTYKKVRKRGAIQFVREKLPDGKWKYKLDGEGKKIPIVAKGDSIRGQLHGESFYGAIKQPKRNENDKILFDENYNMILDDKLILVTKKPLLYKKSADSPGFKTLEEIEKIIIDKSLFEIIRKQTENRNFADALNSGIWMLDKRGKRVNQIKSIRCKVAAGVGYLTSEKALEIKKHNFISKKHEYKQSLYAQNEENNLCLYYEGCNNEKIERGFRIVGLYELSNLKLKSPIEIKKEPFYNSIEKGRGKNKISIQLDYILTVGTKVIFYEHHIEELKEIKNPNEILKRMYRIYKFNEPAPSTVYIYFQNHLEARKNDELGNGEKDINFNKPQSRLFLSASKFTCAIEGKHFEIKPDGEIKWLF